MDLILHLRVRPFTIHFDAFGCRYPENVVASDQNLAQSPSVLPVNILFCVRELDIHVRVDADKSTFVFCLSPLQADYDLLVDQALEQRPGIQGSKVHAVVHSASEEATRI